VLFTSSATEAINTAFHSALALGGRRIVTTVVEHPAVQQCALAAEEHGADVVRLPVDRSGALSLEQLESSISEQTCLVSVMWANNETGIIFPISKIATLCARLGVPLHVDAVQAAGKLRIDLEKLCLTSIIARDPGAHILF
jgi:cysteine desulfurase